MLLQERELRTLKAVADALLPPDASDWRVSTADRAAGCLRFLSRRELGQVRLFLRFLETEAPELLLVPLLLTPACSRVRAASTPCSGLPRSPTWWRSG
jgi:hypothetical protein